jgi:nucleotide-binding universal stress UspA family protein
VASEAQDDAVLLCYDGSEFAKAAVQAAGRQLRTDRRAIVLCVVEPLEVVPFLGATAMIPADIAGHAEKAVEEGVALARKAGFDAEPCVDRGAPIWRRIVELADDRDAGIVVLGSHGRTGIRSVLMGSVATAVAHHSRRPVMIAHRPD